MTYSVTSEDADLDAALARLWGPGLPPGTNPAQKHRWYYQDNPRGAGKVLLLTSSSGSAREKKNFVGCAGIVARTIDVDGTALRAGLLADLGVETDHRTVL